MSTPRASLLCRLLLVVAPASLSIAGCDDGPSAPPGETQSNGGSTGTAGAGGRGSGGTSSGGSAGASALVACSEEPAGATLCVAGEYDKPCVNRRCYEPKDPSVAGCLPGPTSPGQALSAEVEAAIGGTSTCYGDDTTAGATGPYCGMKGAVSCCYLLPQYICEGRPLLVGGAARTAAIAFGVAW